MRVLACLLLAALPLHAVEMTVPRPLEASRYESMMQESPFALATAPSAPAAPTESFAANWNLTGLASLPNSEGVFHDWVSIRSRDGRLSFSLYGDQQSQDPEAEGVSISAVEWNMADYLKSTVMLKKGTEFAKVEFGQEASAPPSAAQPPVNTNATGVPRPSGAPPMIRGPMQPPTFNHPGNSAQPNVVFPGPVPITGHSTGPGAIQNPAPMTRPTLPRPGANVPPNFQGNPVGAPMAPGQQPQANPGRRIRVINSRP
jgi:hypothetical protein